MTVFAVLSLIAGIAGFLIVDNGILKFVVPVLGVALFVLFIFLRIGQSKKAKEVSDSLTDYDNKNAELSDKANQINAKLTEISKKFERHELEKKYEKYTTNHICVFVGDSYFAQSQPSSTSWSYTQPKEATVFIDGVEVGCSKRPFEAFYATPGVHSVKMEAYTVFGGSGGIPVDVTSRAKQVKVSDEKSVYLLYHWSFYNKKGGGIGQELYLHEYDNLYDFLKAVHAI